MMVIEQAKKLMVLVATLLVTNAFLPIHPKENLAAGLAAIATQTVTVSYQRGDGKGDISETDDGTMTNRYVEDSLTRPLDFQADGSGTSLTLKRVKETSGGETRIETRRLVIKFPNIIGSGPNQIPPAAEINSATMTLTTNVVSSATTMSINAYRILEDWEETESGNLKSPSWRNRHPVENENNITQKWTAFGADTPISSESPAVVEAVSISYIVGSTASFDITKTVQKWMSGAPNNGVMLKLRDEMPGGSLRLVGFYSSEWDTVSLRPLLEITYTTKTTPPPQTQEEATTTPPASQPLPEQPQGAPPATTATSVPPAAESTTQIAPPPRVTETPKQTPQIPQKTSPPAVPEQQKPPQAIPARELPDASKEQESVSAPKEDFLRETTTFFKVVQKKILETWARVIRLFR